MPIGRSIKSYIIKTFRSTTQVSSTLNLSITNQHSKSIGYWAKNTDQLFLSQCYSPSHYNSVATAKYMITPLSLAKKKGCLYLTQMKD